MSTGSDMPFTVRYAADVKAKHGVFIPYLPGNTNLGKSVLGAPGARYPDPLARQKWTYELAPVAVRLEHGFNGVKASVGAAVAGGLTQIGDAVERTVTLGLPPHVLGAILVVLALVALRYLRIIPPLVKS